MLSLLVTAVAGAYALWVFATSFAPVPDRLESSVGVVTQVRTYTESNRGAHATFRLKQVDGKINEFSYKPYLVDFFYFAKHVKQGARVEVTTGPGGKHDIWGLKLGSQVLMTPDEARQARSEDGRWGLGVFIACLVLAVCLARVP